MYRCCEFEPHLPTLSLASAGKLGGDCYRHVATVQQFRELAQGRVINAERTAPNRDCPAIAVSALRKRPEILLAQPMPLRAAKERELRFPGVKRQRRNRAMQKQREMVLSPTARQKGPAQFLVSAVPAVARYRRSFCVRRGSTIRT